MHMTIHIPLATNVDVDVDIDLLGCELLSNNWVADDDGGGLECQDL